MNSQLPDAVGVALLAQDDGVCASVIDALSYIGVAPIPLSVDQEWPDNVGTVLICGPFVPMRRLLRKVARYSCRNVILWYTEQTPSPALPATLVRLGARCSWYLNCGAELVAQSVGIPVVQKLARRALCIGTRWRLSGEIQWLHARGYLELLAVLSPSRQKYFVQKLGVPAKVIPYGYHKSFGDLLDVERDIDVVFLGSLRDRRRSRIVANLEPELGRMGIGFVIKDGSPTRGCVFGDQRTRLLNRSKIMLNIMRQPWDDIVFRMLLAAPNGVMVVSEPVLDTSPFEPGKHFAVASLGQIGETVRYYLDHPQERSIITQNAYDLVVNQLSAGRMVEILLSERNAPDINRSSLPVIG